MTIEDVQTYLGQVVRDMVEDATYAERRRITELVEQLIYSEDTLESAKEQMLAIVNGKR